MGKFEVNIQIIDSNGIWEINDKIVLYYYVPIWHNVLYNVHYNININYFIYYNIMHMMEWGIKIKMI